MELEDIKAGMKVVVTKKWGDYEDGWENAWVPEMSEAIGKSFTVEQVTPESGIGIKTNSGLWWFPWQVLEPYAEEFLNESLTPFRDLADEQKLLIIREKEKGNVEIRVCCLWAGCSPNDVYFDGIYRTKPVEKEISTTLNLPWQYIKPKYKWAAMDEDGACYVYTDSPVADDVAHGWDAELGECKDISALVINTQGIIWNKSLTKRPE